MGFKDNIISREVKYKRINKRPKHHEVTNKTFINGYLTFDTPFKQKVRGRHRDSKCKRGKIFNTEGKLKPVTPTTTTMTAPSNHPEYFTAAGSKALANPTFSKDDETKNKNSINYSKTRSYNTLLNPEI